MFSSLNSDFRKTQKAVFPSVGKESEELESQAAVCLLAPGGLSAAVV